MGNYKKGFDLSYDIGSLKIRIYQPEKRKCELDYIIHWNGVHQFSDLHLFQDLLTNIQTIEEMNIFLNSFSKSKFISFSDKCVQTNISNRKDVIDYVNSLNLNDTLKLCLASIFFRCEIDNINYICPRLNGCVRHYIQILALFAYRFNIEHWKTEEISPFIKNGNLSQVISDSGYPYTAIGKKVGVHPFKDKFLELKRKGLI